MDENLKLDTFVKTILNESTGDIDEIRREMERKFNIALSEARTSVTAEALRYKEAKISEIRAREGRRVNTRMTDNKKALLRFREDCAREVFNEVRSRIIAYTETPEYFDYFRTNIPLALNKLLHGYSARVFLRAEDMKFADDILALARGVTMTVDKGYFHIGGFHMVCPSRGMRIDMSFDTALKGFAGHFAEMSGMQVE